MKFFDYLTRRWIGERTLTRRIEEYQVTREELGDYFDYALGRLESARPGASERYWQRQVDAARSGITELDKALQSFEDQEGDEDEIPKPEPGPREGSYEWEFGAYYETHREHGAHNVGFNVRLTFNRRVTEREARRALEIFVGGGNVRGASVAAVDWARPNDDVRTGDQSDLESFANVIAEIGVKNLRAGGVKLDEL